METIFDNFTFFRYNFPILLITYRKLEYSTISAKYLKCAIFFLKQCILEQVIPVSLKCSIFTNYLNDPFPNVYRYISEDRIRVLKAQLNARFAESSYLYYHLKSRLHPNIFYKLIDFCHNVARNKSERRRACWSLKLVKLCHASTWDRYSCAENVVNLSSYNLKQDEKTLLGLGLGFSMPPSKKDKFSFVSKICKSKDYLSIYSPQAGF